MVVESLGVDGWSWKKEESSPQVKIGGGRNERWWELVEAGTTGRSWWQWKFGGGRRLFMEAEERNKESVILGRR